LLGLVLSTLQSLQCHSIGVELKAQKLARIPIVINSYNRVSCLKKLVDLLQDIGQHNIIILDNNSTYPPLLRYYRELEASYNSTCAAPAEAHLPLTPGTRQCIACQGALIVYLRQNFGHKALWESGIGETLNIFKDVYIYTDPDILPVQEFPRNFVAMFSRIMLEYPTAEKVGCALKIDDLPDSYVYKDQVVRWEEEFWSDWRTLPLPAPLKWLELDTNNPTKMYQGDIDTTFALYRAGHRDHSYGPAIRVGGRLAARHLPWYSDSSNPTPEEIYYATTARESGFWTRTSQAELSARMVAGNGRVEGSN
jgi:hypothetical protein